MQGIELSCATSIRARVYQLSILVRLVIRARGYPGVTGRHLLEFNIETLEEDFDFELQVEFELCKLVELNHEVQHCHEPWVGQLEDVGLGTLLHDLADKGNGYNESVAVIALDEEIFEDDVALTDGLVLGQSEASEPRTQVLEQIVLLHRLNRLVTVQPGKTSPSIRGTVQIDSSLTYTLCSVKLLMMFLWPLMKLSHSKCKSKTEADVSFLQKKDSVHQATLLCWHAMSDYAASFPCYKV
ncbi:uncharacterized protein UBRO_20709 [Ustilago bromivora]|uniref:Uncharacterized protein n=1 Tax=Ustilago bromivora TaxID=307758 RepID=A0A1K0GR97_9BASI|nr:uncharacterized protein UBRO_20709 [Ustilago bromivora]